jgi:hypothetical protein
MRRQFLSGLCLALILPSQLLAQESASPPPVPATVATKAVGAALPPNTEVLVTMNSDLTSKGGRIDEGHMFDLTVSQDVKHGENVVIPKGSPAKGEVVWLTGKGAFGKSGKMEIELRYIELDGNRIPISGRYRQEGEGNTVGTVAGVVAVGVFAAFITGKSARIPQGRELKAYTKESFAYTPSAPVPPLSASEPVPAPTSPSTSMPSTQPAK